MYRQLVDKIDTPYLFKTVAALLKLYFHRYTNNKEITCPLCWTAIDIQEQFEVRDRIHYVTNFRQFRHCKYCPWVWIWTDAEFNPKSVGTQHHSSYSGVGLCSHLNRHIHNFGTRNVSTEYKQKRKEEIKNWIIEIIEYIEENREHRTDKEILSCILEYVNKYSSKIYNDNHCIEKVLEYPIWKANWLDKW